MRSKSVRTVAIGPMAAWDRHVSAADDPTTLAWEADADALAIRYARLAAYVAARRNGKGHTEAVKAQNRVGHALRRVLGYAYRTDIIF